jgi:DNA helicase-2/ATP-dependent DNA helicase PcrA
VESQSKRILVKHRDWIGKTHVLISRIIRLVGSGDAQPGDVLALTYTNKAMNVMQERLSKNLKEKGYILNKNVLTYHNWPPGLLNRMIETRAQKLSS